MKKLLKIYGFNDGMQYFQMCADSFINGQLAQAKEQFKALPKEDKKRMVGSMFTTWNIRQDIALFFFNQL